MAARKDRTGERYGHLVIDKMLFNILKPGNKRKRTYAECTCDCGNKCTKLIDSIVSSPHPSCGCMDDYYRKINNRTDERGQKFGRLTILDIDYSQHPSKAKCICDCGNVISVAKVDVVSGHTQSCGCLRAERTAQANYVDSSGYINDFGVEIIRPIQKLERGVWEYECKCPKCGKLFNAIPACVKENKIKSCGCESLRTSSGERFIKNILDLEGVDYLREYKFTDCKDKYMLPFDFAVFDQVNNLEFLIEYDGAQHFSSTDWFGGQEAFEIRKLHDDMKNKYCNNNNIRLVRYKYDQDFKEIKEGLSTLIGRSKS